MNRLTEIKQVIGQYEDGSITKKEMYGKVSQLAADGWNSISDKFPIESDNE